MFDIIGDIHGHSEELKALLTKMSYTPIKSTYAHPERKVIFVGDYIDRGPKIRETLDIVRRMVDSGNAIALMGNHEYNALCYHCINSNGGYLREHTEKNIQQHSETLRQFESYPNEFKEYLNWFKTLPLFYETEKFRAVHACWDDDHINYLKTKTVHGQLTDELIYESAKKGSDLYKVVDETLKGKEITMPDGLSFTDKDGHVRTEIRIKWWEDLTNATYKSISVISMDELPETPIDLPNSQSINYYNKCEKPVFFGHFWLQGNPSLYRSNVCCLDYSVAKKGKLVAYRLDEEMKLREGKLVWV